MKNKFAKGFTLIEVLVVIVIMGILAAVAVPKLFASVAKAKASEIAPAAGTYQKLQDLHLMEKASVGTWKSIGYEAPGSGTTTNFIYCGGEVSEEVKYENFGEESKVGWQATNNVSLNECSAGHWWFVSIKLENSHTAIYSTETNAEECIALAKPDWTVASRSGMACGEAGSEAQKELTPSDVGYTMTIGATKAGGWGPDHAGQTNSSSQQISTFNDDPDSDGLFKLEPNSTYEYTIEVPADLWVAENGALLQTHTRVYSEYDANNKITIVCGSTTNKEEDDPNLSTSYVGDNKGGLHGANGYNTGSDAAKKAGYTAEANMETVTKEDGSTVVRTTVTLTTGDKGGSFGATFFSVNNEKSVASWNQKNQTDKKEAAENAIKNSTLTLVSKKDESKASSSSSN